MTGATISPPSARMAAVTAPWQQKMVSLMNSSRVAAVTDRLVWLLQSGGESNAKEVQNLCLSLARGIDYALANNEIPDKAQELPRLLKQNACKIGWFSDMESQELFALVNEIGSSFCSTGNVQTGTSDFQSTISVIMGRFYPLMKMGQILASLEVKPGYKAYAVDVHISKTMSHSPQEKICLLVAQTDNTETFACIISPQNVNLLLNGKGIERRSGISVDSGPQMPTNVTGMLQYGTNLLQAVGQFNGHFIIVLAFMNISSLPEAPVLEDYVQSGTPTTDSENDIIEGPSRISLKCPISFRRIATPVKGHRCKHLQCFDFSNYVNINSRRPSWRCPHCNQPVCYTELRIDQNTVKVLRAVGEEVTDIILSADGSWKAVLERDDNEDVAHDKELHLLNEKLELQKSTIESIPVPVILDLTDNDDNMDTMGSYENEDRKIVQADLQNPLAATNFTTQNNRSISIQNASGQIEEEFWDGIYLSNLSAPADVSSGAEIRNNTSDSTFANFMMSPVLTDAVPPAFNQRAEPHMNINPTTSVLRSQFSAPTNLQLQQAQFVNPMAVQNEYGQSASMPRNTRIPVAVQALPALSQTNSPQQSARSGYGAPSLAPQASLPMAPIGNNFSTISDVASSMLQHHTTAQNASPQDFTFIPSQSVQQTAGIQPSRQHFNPHFTQFQNPHLQQAPNLSMPAARSLSPSLIESPFTRTQTQQRAMQVGVGQSAGPGYSQPGRFTSAMLQPAQMATRSTSVPAQTTRPASSYPVNQKGARASTTMQCSGIGGMLPPVSRADGLVDLPSEQNWRPVGQMRGSLSGQAYYAALSQYMNLPTHSAQVGIQPNLTLPSSSVPAHFRSAPPTRQIQNSTRIGAAGISRVSGFRPAHSMGMN